MRSAILRGGGRLRCAVLSCACAVIALLEGVCGFTGLVLPQAIGSRGRAMAGSALPTAGGRGVSVRWALGAPARSGARAARAADVSMTAAATPLGGLAAFLDASPTPYHMVATASAQLRNEGFVELKEGFLWAEEGALERGGKYFYHREGSTLVAFTVGGNFEPGARGSRLSASWWFVGGRDVVLTERECKKDMCMIILSPAPQAFLRAAASRNATSGWRHASMMMIILFHVALKAHAAARASCVACTRLRKRAFARIIYITYFLLLLLLLSSSSSLLHPHPHPHPHTHPPTHTHTLYVFAW